MTTVETPAARATDPAPSHEAADEITCNGRRAQQQHTVATVVWSYPGRTSAELARLCGLERHAVARRLPEVELAGTVKRGEIRPCTVGGRRATTWEPA